MNWSMPMNETFGFALAAIAVSVPSAKPYVTMIVAPSSMSSYMLVW
jgi:hypothetical protein